MHGVRKAVIKTILVFVFVMALQEVIRFCYYDWTNTTIWSKKERKELEGTIDTLYCGTSIAYVAFDPEILDEELGTSSFNLGTSAQPYIGTYYLIRETAEKNPIERIYLSISLPSLLKEQAYLANYLSAYANMNSWKWKLAYLSAVNQEKVWISALGYSTQVDDYLALDKVKENLEKKLLSPTIPDNYGGRGYRLNNKVLTGSPKKKNTKTHTWYEDQEESRIQEEAITYLEKIAEFCNEKGIELTLISLPYSQAYIDGVGYLDGFHQYLTDKAEEWNVDFYNFILYKERETMFTNQQFQDRQHLNTDGGTTFSYLLAEIVQSEDPQAYFYDSYSEFEEF